MEKENSTHDALRSQSPEKDSIEKTPKGSPTKMLPSTPAMRLPLADLVGNAEEALRRHDEPKQPSPDEQVGWIANSSHPDLTPRQKRRRAQSSSPISSSQERASAIDFKNMQQSIRTPRTISDPAANLWSRYASGRNGGDVDCALPFFAHLIEPSSPRSGPRTPGASVSGLRRWASCGMDFPASKTKRRRTHGVFRDGSQDQDTSQSDKPKPVSRVGMLLERVQASLAQPQHLKKDAPSSSSPLPDKGEFPDIPIASPVRTSRPSTRPSQNERPSQRSFRSVQSHGNLEADVDEFGGDELDLDMDQTMEVQHQPSRIPHSEPQRLGLIEAPQDNRIASIKEDWDESGDEFDDEFGGDDLDISLEDMDNAVPIFDTRSSSRNHTASTSAAYSRYVSENQPDYISGPVQERKTTATEMSKPRSSIVLAQEQVQVDLTGFSDDDDDDDFGGFDLDDEAFAQAEFSATQAAAHQASGAIQSSVRISNLPSRR